MIVMFGFNSVCIFDYTLALFILFTIAQLLGLWTLNSSLLFTPWTSFICILLRYLIHLLFCFSYHFVFFLFMLHFLPLFSILSIVTLRDYMEWPLAKVWSSGETWYISKIGHSELKLVILLSHLYIIFIFKSMIFL